MTDTAKTSAAVAVAMGAAVTHGSIRAFCVCVCARCLPWKAGAAQSLLPPTQKTSSLLDAEWGKFGPDVTSNKGKATGIEGGIRPIFRLTPRPASSWHLSIFLLFCSLAEGSLVSSRLKGAFFFYFYC